MGSLLAGEWSFSIAAKNAIQSAGTRIHDAKVPLLLETGAR
jgi:hypothetical protein